MLLLFFNLKSKKEDIDDLLDGLSKNHYVEKVNDKMFITDASYRAVKLNDKNDVVQSVNNLKEEKDG